ncbi:unnamed protein product [Prunus armeniaca]
MVVKGHVRDTACYKTLVDGYIKVKRIHKALRLAEEMTQRELFPDLEMQNTLRSFHAKWHVAFAE